MFVNGDMLGPAKLSGIAGHSALYDDFFSLVQGPALPRMMVVLRPYTTQSFHLRRRNITQKMIMLI